MKKLVLDIDLEPGDTLNFLFKGKANYPIILFYDFPDLDFGASRIPCVFEPGKTHFTAYRKLHVTELCYNNFFTPDFIIERNK